MAPDGGHGLIAGQDRDARQLAGQFPAAVGTPAADLGPLCQLTERDEGDERFAADQARGQRPGELQGEGRGFEIARRQGNTCSTGRSSLGCNRSKII